MGAVVLFPPWLSAFMSGGQRDEQNEEKAESLVVSFGTLPIILNAEL